MQNPDSDSSLVLSFIRLRQLIGILGIGMPVVMILYAIFFGPCGTIENSISAYYHTHMRNVFVGILCATGVFMITYIGFERRDTIASTMAGFFAIGIAMFPTNDPSLCELNGLINKTVGAVHDGMALGLFLTFSYISIKLFTLTSGGMTDKKKHRNVVYKIWGWSVLACIALMILHRLTGILPASMHPTFCLEAISLIAFGVSWLTEGEGIKFLNDD
jgi:hypothetical protein